MYKKKQALIAKKQPMIDDTLIIGFDDEKKPDAEMFEQTQLILDKPMINDLLEVDEDPLFSKPRPVPKKPVPDFGIMLPPSRIQK